MHHQITDFFLQSDNDSNEDVNIGVNRKNLTVGDFVLVQFPLKTTKDYYIGDIKGIDVYFLRRKGNSSTFYFPAVQDINDVDPEDLVSILPKPTLTETVRTQSIYSFKKNLNFFIDQQCINKFCKKTK